MKQDEDSQFCAVFFCVIGIVLGALIGYTAGWDSGYDNGRDFTRQQAVRYGAAKYATNALGEVYISWNTKY